MRMQWHSYFEDIEHPRVHGVAVIYARMKEFSTPIAVLSDTRKKQWLGNWLGIATTGSKKCISLQSLRASFVASASSSYVWYVLYDDKPHPSSKLWLTTNKWQSITFHLPSPCQSKQLKNGVVGFQWWIVSSQYQHASQRSIKDALLFNVCDREFQKSSILVSVVNLLWWSIWRKILKNRATKLFASPLSILTREAKNQLLDWHFPRFFNDMLYYDYMKSFPSLDFLLLLSLCLFYRISVHCHVLYEISMIIMISIFVFNETDRNTTTRRNLQWRGKLPFAHAQASILFFCRWGACTVLLIGIHTTSEREWVTDKIELLLLIRSSVRGYVFVRHSDLMASISRFFPRASCATDTNGSRNLSTFRSRCSLI